MLRIADPPRHRHVADHAQNPCDGLPFIGELPGKPRVKYLAGHTGHGFGFGFLAAKKLVDMAVDGDPIGWLGAGRLAQKAG